MGFSCISPCGLRNLPSGLWLHGKRFNRRGLGWVNKGTLAAKCITIFGKILMENWEECTVSLQAFRHSHSPVPCHFGSMKLAKFIVINGSTLKGTSKLFFVMSRNALAKKCLLIIEFLCFHNRFKQCIIEIWHQVDRGQISTVETKSQSVTNRVEPT